MIEERLTLEREIKRLLAELDRMTGEAGKWHDRAKANAVEVERLKALAGEVGLRGQIDAVWAEADKRIHAAWEEVERLRALVKAAYGALPKEKV
jgi:hypothetical protein